MRYVPLLWTLLALGALAPGATVGCASAPTTPDWESRLTAALCTRAERLLGEGDRAAARASATEALERAVRQGDRTSEARARHVLGLVAGTQQELDAAMRLLDGTSDTPEQWRVRLVLASLALQAGEFETALSHVEPVMDASSDLSDIHGRARLEAPASHILAGIARRRGQLDEGRAHERWANLQLTVLHDNELMPLRVAVAQALGDDQADEGRLLDAFQSHARASNIAARIADEAAELAAVRSMSRDLVLLDRWFDAADHAAWAARLAKDQDDWAAAEQIAREALSWLDVGGEPRDSHRRSLFREILEEASRVEGARRDRPPGSSIPSSGDSQPRGG